MTEPKIPEETIRKLAHEIWEAEGRPEDRDRRHWFRAEAILRERLTETRRDNS